jgi:hypothetical protein
VGLRELGVVKLATTPVAAATGISAAATTKAKAIVGRVPGSGHTVFGVVIAGVVVSACRVIVLCNRCARTTEQEEDEVGRKFWRVWISQFLSRVSVW